MNRIPRSPCFALLLLALALPTLARAQADDQPIRSAPPKNMSIPDVIRAFAQKESEFAKAREQYTYHQTVKVQALEGDTVDGEYQQTTDINFDPNARRVEQVIYAPQPTHTRAGTTPHFTGRDAHTRETVKFTNYKRFGSTVKITSEGKEVQPGEKQPQAGPPAEPQSGTAAPPRQ